MLFWFLECCFPPCFIRYQNQSCWCYQERPSWGPGQGLWPRGCALQCSWVGLSP